MLPLSSCVYVIELEPLEARYWFALLCVRYSVLVVPLMRTPLVFQSPSALRVHCCRCLRFASLVYVAISVWRVLSVPRLVGGSGPPSPHASRGCAAEWSYQ